jgi:hypothetical protein
LEPFWWFVIVVAGVLVGSLLNLIHGSASASSLRDQMAALGQLTGKTYQEVVNAAGEPRHSSHTGDGLVVHTWISTTLPNAPSYSCSLVFENNVCLGLASEDYAKPF